MLIGIAFISSFLFGFSLSNTSKSIQNFLIIEQGQTFAQSFTTLHKGLDRIDINISQPAQSDARLMIRLYENTPDRKLIYESVFLFPQSADKSKQLIQIPAQKESYLKDYFLELSWQGPSDLQVEVAPGYNYDQGSMYIDKKPVEFQLVFSLHYNPIYMISGLLIQGAMWIWQLFLTSLIIILPGWAIMVATWKPWSGYDSLTKISVSAGISFALYPVLMLFTDAIKFYPGELFFVWFPVLISLAYLTWYCKEKLISAFKNPRTFLSLFKPKGQTRFTWLGVSTFIIVILVIAVRLWAIRALSTPMWGDSYQHTVITQLIMDNGGLFKSWMPYALYNSLTVHFGFHANSAVYAWVSNASASQAVIWMAQIANILAVLGLYPIARRLPGAGNWAGPATILVAGLVTSMPNFYVNWGRYAQLSGQVILPVSAFLLLETLFVKEKRVTQIVVCALTLSGMALSYYRAPLFMLIFLPILLFEMVKWILQPKVNKIAWLLTVLSILIITAILLLPLLPRLSQGKLAIHISYEQNAQLITLLQSIWEQWLRIFQYYPKYLFVILAIAFFAALIQKHWHFSLLPLGFILLQSYSLGVLISLPLSNFAQVFAIQILLYLLIGLMTGYLVNQLFEIIGKRHHPIGAIILILLAFWFALSAKNVLNKTDHEYVTWADQRAFEWIKSNTLTTALFLVDGFTIYNGTSAVGSDAGWWIPLLTGRGNTMPPQYALLNERPIQEGYSQWIVEVHDEFRVHSPASPEGLKAMCRWGISHIYSGQKRGILGQPTALLNWQEWPDAAWLDLVYAEDRVRIFALDPTYCK